MKFGWNNKLFVYFLTTVLVLMGFVNILSIGPAEDIGASASILNQPKTVAAHAPIRIDSDADFTGANGVNYGSGSASSPYIIDNWDINGSGYGYGIYIGNTTKHFIIRNCTINNVTGNQFAVFYYDTGIYVNNSLNGLVYNNTIVDNNGYGIYFDEVDDSVIQDNRIFRNEYSGIRLKLGFNVTITANEVSFNNQGAGFDAGIFLQYSDKNIIEWNYVSNNPENGVYLLYSDKNTFNDNEIVFNCGGQEGIMIDKSHSNIFYTNNLSNNTGEGVEIFLGNNNVFRNNTISGNGGSSFAGVIANGLNNQFYENVVEYNGNDGFFVQGLTVVLEDNIITHNNRNGLYLNSVYGYFENNSILYNSENGIYMNSGDHHNILHNSFEYNTLDGINASGATFSNYIYKNNFIDNRLLTGGPQGYDGSMFNYWNNSQFLGNYWSDYTTKYPSAIIIGSIWDTPYDLNGSNNAKDYYPLAYPVEFDEPIIIDHSPAPTTGDIFTFICNVTDNIKVKNVSVKYWFGLDDSSAINVPMMFNASQVNYSHSISIPQGTTETLNYIYTSVDINNNWAIIGPITIQVIDNDPPTAHAGNDENIFIFEQADFDGSLSMDNIALANFTWSFVYNGSIENLNGSQPSFIFEIAGDYIVELEVFDPQGNNDTDSMWVYVVDNINPLYDAPKHPIEVNMDEEISITINVSDSSGLADVILAYRDVNYIDYNVSMTLLFGDTWGYSIPGQNYTGTLVCTILASDIFNNTIETLKITAVLHDNIEIWTVKLNYTNIYGFNYNVTMTQNRGINYTFTIPAQEKQGTVTFYVWLIDVSGNENRSELKKITIESIKIDRPEISWVNIPTQTEMNEPILIKVNVADALGLDMVKINYDDVNDFRYNDSMTAGSNNEFSFEIPGQNKTGTLKLHIAANNSLGNWNTTEVRTVTIITPQPKDQDPPKVLSTIPIHNATDVGVNIEIKVTFNESLNITDFKTSIIIKPDIVFNISWDENHKVLTIEPQSDLKYDTEYTITLEKGIGDLVDNVMTESFVFTFTTEGEPVNNDLDGDGLPNVWETTYSLNPNDPSDANNDTDNDGLTNLQEYSNQTDPTKKDSDNDGLNDGDEVKKHNTDPNDDDSDNDGYKDGLEIEKGSDPNNSDSKPKEEVDDYSTIIIILLLIIIIIVILVAVLSRRRKKPEEEAEPEEEGEEEETEEEEDAELEEEEPEDVEPEDIELDDIGKEPIGEEEELIDIELGEEEPSAKKSAKKGILPKKDKLPITAVPEETELIDEGEYEKEEIEPELVKLEGKSVSCGICLGTIKAGLMAVKCKCGKYYHESCGVRVGECPKCDRTFILEKMAKVDEGDMEELEEIEESDLSPEEFEKQKEQKEKTKREKSAKILEKLEERLAEGEISEATYLMLREKYEKKK
jgi:parallel beta-helix repeat protein